MGRKADRDTDVIEKTLPVYEEPVLIKDQKKNLAVSMKLKKQTEDHAKAENDRLIKVEKHAAQVAKKKKVIEAKTLQKKNGDHDGADVTSHCISTPLAPNLVSSSAKPLSMANLIMANQVFPFFFF